jgi:ankyrin repeat protein
MRAHAADGGTPLHRAAGNGHEETVRMLVELGTDVRAGDTHGVTLLHYAAIRGHEDVVRRLMKVWGDASA